MNNTTFIYSLFVTAVVLMIITLVLTWKSALPRSTKWTLTVFRS